MLLRLKLTTLLDAPSATVPKVKDGTELDKLPGAMPAPEALMLPLPPGVAEYVMNADRAPVELGVKMTCTVQVAFAANTVTPETQSPAIPVWKVNSVLLEASETGPLGC